jgi:hypothetical protein
VHPILVASYLTSSGVDHQKTNRGKTLPTITRTITMGTLMNAGPFTGVDGGLLSSEGSRTGLLENSEGTGVTLQITPGRKMQRKTTYANIG